MYRRMLRMADALSALGVVVHVVLHEWHKDAPSTMPQQRLYKGSMRQQYEKAVEAAGPMREILRNVPKLRPITDMTRSI